MQTQNQRLLYLWKPTNHSVQFNHICITVQFSEDGTPLFYTGIILIYHRNERYHNPLSSRQDACKYSISQEICTRFLLCCALLWLYIDWFSHIHQAYFTGTVAIVRQSNDCPSASKATLMNMDKYLMWIHYERLHNHNKAKHNKTVCIFLGIYYIRVHAISHDMIEWYWWNFFKRHL